MYARSRHKISFHFCRLSLYSKYFHCRHSHRIFFKKPDFSELFFKARDFSYPVVYLLQMKDICYVSLVKKISRGSVMIKWKGTIASSSSTHPIELGPE